VPEKARIYVVLNRNTGKIARYVRAKTLTSALRAVAEEIFTAEHASTETMFQAMTAPTGLDVLNAIEPTQVDIEDAAEPQLYEPDVQIGDVVIHSAQRPD
jgi:hypothetical protein